MAGTQQHTSAQKGSAAADKQAAHAPGVRGWIAAHRLISAVAAVLVFVAMPLVGLLLFTPAEKQEGPVTLAVALAALDRGDLEQARRMAERLIDGAALADDERGGPPYIFGVAASQQADSLLDQNRASLSLVAARHLEDARDLGFPHGREAAGLWLLGRNLYRAGQLAASAEPLEAALTLNPQHSSAIHPWLAEAYQAGEKPDLVRALEHSKTWLDDPQLFDEQRQQGLLQQGVILFKQQKFAECRQVLRQIATKAPQYSEALIVEGRMLLAEGLATKDSTASADKEKLSQAIEVFQRSRNEGSAKDQVALCAAYLIGLCYEHLSDRRAALEHYAQAGQGDRPESIAAMMHAAELLLEEGRQAEAVEAYRGALGEIRSPATDNPWLPLEELRSRATNAYLRLLEKGAFELARSLLEGWHPAFDRMRQIQLQAQTHRAWAIALKDQVDDLPAAEAAAQRGAIEQQFRLAGQLYSRLAELRFAHRQYPDDLWDAIESFSMAHDYPAAIKVLETYLEHEPVRRRAEALQRLGEAMLVEGRTDDAIQTLRQSVEFDPKNAASYRSKILASKALVDAGDLAGAEVLLLENIQSEYLTPASIEWRETLFQLGRLLHLEQRYSDAIERLEEAVARYPEDRQSTLAHYLIADGYRQQAKEISTELEKTVVESARLALGREMHRLLEGAITHYDQAMARLQSPVEASASQEPAEAQATILRNCHFMKGAALFDLGRYDEAIRAYSSATNRYQHEPEVLDAYVKVADCYRRLNRLSEARGTIEQAKVVLNRMPGDVSFADKSNFDRQEWARHLEWLSGVY